MRVIPLEEQTHSDSWIAGVVLVILGVIVLVGLLGGTDLWRSSVTAAAGVVLLLSLAVVGTILIGMSGRSTPRRPLAVSAPPAPQSAPVQIHSSQLATAPERLGPTLDYRSPAEDYQPVRAGPFAGGFFAALGVCAAGFLLLAATVDTQPKATTHPLFLLLTIGGVIAVAVAGGLLGHRPGWRGFGRGVALGLVLGLMALGPCGFCYLMTF